MRLQHVSVAIAEEGADAAREFYGGLLGLEEKPVPPKLDPNELVWFRVGGDLELHLMRTGDEPPPNAHLCLAVELRRAGYGDNGERLGFDLYPYTEDAVGSVKRSVLQWQFIDGIASRIDDAGLRAAQQEKDAVRAYELVYAAMGA